jgi:hypothetical protein
MPLQQLGCNCRSDPLIWSFEKKSVTCRMMIHCSTCQVVIVSYLGLIEELKAGGNNASCTAPPCLISRPHGLTALGSLIPSFPWTLSRNSPSLLVLHQCAREWFDWTELDLGLFRTRGRQWISLGQVAIYLLWLSQGRFGTEWSPLDPAGMNIGQGFEIFDLCLLGFASLAVSVQGQNLDRFVVGL